VVAPEIVNIAREFRRALLENGIAVEHIFVFGSHAADSAAEWSDIDLAVIAPEFGRDRFRERVLLMKIACRVDPRIEPFPLGCREFEQEGWRMMIHEIKTRGIEIAA